ncbi:relaxase/mobilization nuclease domain-containing protein [Roseinatronobacter ekhonensis]|nr:relaxase/mobilization nuclease domain-containing protein [Roseibaca ekhonensis]
MIIKSMSRKAPTFGQLAAYIGRSAERDAGTAFVRNLYSDGADRSAVVDQFSENYRYLPARKGGNALYHEVIVLEPQQHLPGSEVEAMLHQLAEEYCSRRAPHQLAWGQVHHDTEFPHIHLMISANAVRSDRRVRMDRTYFAGVQRDLERWRAEHLPELRTRVVYGKEHEKQTPRQPVQEGEMVRRTNTPSRKQQVHDHVKVTIIAATDRTDFERRLGQTGLGLYQRGQTVGVVDQATGKRYRLKTLGLDAAFRSLETAGRETVRLEPKQAFDDRAETLLRQRMEATARHQIDEFDRDDRERE